MPHTAVPIPGGSNQTEPIAILKIGDSGNAVRIIQERLIALGFNPGVADGQFGPATAGALQAFQMSRGVQGTGSVDVATLHALGYEVDTDAAPIATAPPQQQQPSSSWPSLALVCQLFPDAKRFNVETYLPLILKALREYGLTDAPMVLAALATIRAETAGFVPISEGISQFNTFPNGSPFARYDFMSKIGNGAIGDGARYKGRGFIQLTGKANYAQYSQKLGMNDLLVQRPELANDPLIAARLLACFMADKASIIRTALASNDFATARKAVNGGKNGLDAFTTAYRTGARQSGLIAV